jgi:hypothetical protein
VIKVEEKKRRIEASFLDDLFRDLSKSMLHGVMDRFEGSVRTLVGWSLKRLALSIIALGLTITALILILVAGVEGLREASLPPSLAYLIAGSVGLLGGVLLFRFKSP